MNYSSNKIEYQDDFVRAMAKNGIVPVRDIFFHTYGEIIRFGVVGDKAGSKNGWAIIFPGGRGVFGSWKLDISVNWSADYCRYLTKKERKEEIIQLIKCKKLYEKAKIQQQKKAAEKCSNIWNSAFIATDTSHEYIVNKKIRAYGIRQIENQLLVPIQNIHGELVNIQFIHSYGIKKFQLGAAVSGNFMVIGKLSDTVYIVEGFATGSTIHEISGSNVVIAFSVRNLEKVVANLQSYDSNLNIIIAADNDHFSEKNIGLSVAIKISKKFNTGLVYPKFKLYQQGSDFNDLTSYYSHQDILTQLQELEYDSAI